MYQRRSGEASWRRRQTWGLEELRGRTTTGQVARMSLGQEARVFGFAGDTSCLHDDHFDMAAPPPPSEPPALLLAMVRLPLRTAQG